MKINIAYPRNGTVKQFEVTDDQLRRVSLQDYRLGSEIDGSAFGDEFAGYVFQIRGGQDKDGFPMVHGVMAFSRVSLLLKRGAVGFNTFRGYQGERRRKSVRGCILAADIACLNLTIVKLGEQPIEGVTDVTVPNRLGPKRANTLRKFFNLKRDDDVRKFLVRRKVSKEGKKDRFKCAKVQRLITPTIKARRAKKLADTFAKVKKSAETRREFLHSLAAHRRALRQRAHAKKHAHKVQQQKREMAAFQKK